MMETIGYIATAVICVVICIWIIVGVGSFFQKKQLPSLAGTAIPETGSGIDLSKNYDIVYTGDFGSHFVERLSDVRIVGYVGQGDDENVGKMYMRSRWLIVEFRDGRRAYLMPHAILSLQETLARLTG